MAASTAGIQMRGGSRRWREAIELVSSMRFAISLLTLICIAAIVGTVVKQHEPFNNYVNQFGPFWAEAFLKAGLYTVYGAWWFLLILGFLVVSTSLCIARNVPKILADLRTYKEHVREQSLQAFHHKGQGRIDETPDASAARIGELLAAIGWKAKVDVRRDGDAVRGTMIAARKGTSNKLGYIAAHSAIVLICLGGLFDGDLIIKAQMALQGKSSFQGTGLFRDVPAEHRLGPNTPTFRGNLAVSEGSKAGIAVINMPDGVVLQELPFDVELKKFIVDYYATGMPKLFASEIVIHDRQTGASKAATVKVNEPVTYDGVTIYQSSFDDGGSLVKLKALPLAGGAPFEVVGRIGASSELESATGRPEDKLTLEFAGLRVINVENFANAGQPAEGGTDVRKVDLVSSLEGHLGAGVKTKTAKTLRNIGPSVSYRLRDASGQAREYNNYMQPVELDGQRVYLAGVRDSLADNFRYLRIPADDNDSIATWERTRAALADPALRSEAARRYVAMATPDDKPEMKAQLLATAERGLGLFAAAEPAKGDAKPQGGLLAISDFLESNVPQAERQRISEVLLRIVNGSLYELVNLTRERAGQSRLESNEKTQAFMTQLLISLSDSYFYPAPAIFQLDSFEQVQASVFQVARAPGKNLVYLGAVFLIIGVFAMLYIRERRLWIWLQPDGAGTRITTAMSTSRRTLDGDAEFDRLKHTILKDSP